MSVDLVHPAVEKITLVLEGIGDDNIRVNSASLDHPLVILPDQAIEIVAIEKKVMVGRVTRSAYAEPRPERAGRRRGTVRRLETAFRRLKRRSRNGVSEM
jgi:hypothetical protein